MLFDNLLQVVHAPKVFMKNLHVKNLVVEESINGVSIAELCRLDENCVITAPKDFEALTVDGGLTVNNFVVRNRLNGIRAAELLEDSMLYSGEQFVMYTKRFNECAVSLYAEVAAACQCLHCIYSPASCLWTQDLR